MWWFLLIGLCFGEFCECERHSKRQKAHAKSAKARIVAKKSKVLKGGWGFEKKWVIWLVGLKRGGERGWCEGELG